eukprot:TRINITY_DN6515_c2_g1_i1.p1 TRINITY_DN6515_c2_g1~~TRINITY_DN6515_c2_g1_i1.p1  ORF type:complete len:780 (-),score=101.37 TRINITY_DN6515_c2_g1_i1:276-2615(-)
MAMAALLFTLFSLSAISTAAAQIQTPNITLGSSISINGNSTYWVSPSRRFAFGFYPIGNGFMVGVWIIGISNNTVIWTAKRDDPPISSGTVLLSTDGRLLLSSGGSNRSLIDASGVASYASMLDNGNFVLYNSNSNIIWQSFNFPTDTIVAEQRLIVEWTLFSHFSETNHSTGRFRIVMHTDGNLVSYPTDTTNTSRDAYWHSATWMGGRNVSLNLDTDGQLYLLNSTGFTVKNLAENRTGAFVYRATMDVDGIFRLYSHRIENNGSVSEESIVWKSLQLADLCEIKGTCGFNSYCNMGEDMVARCNCPEGFDFVDAQQTFRGCDTNFIKQDCGRGTEGSTWTVTTLENVYWEDDEYALLWVANEEGCKQACLEDCDCMAALFKGGRCSKQKLPLRYGNRTDSATTFIKVGRGGTVMDPTSREVTKTAFGKGVLVVGLVLIACSFITLLCSCFLVYRHKVVVYGRIPEHSSTPAFIEEMNLRSFTYDQLARVTDNFKEELGRGSFGKVYKGFLPNGINRTIAVKKIEKLAEEGEREFEAEMKTIGRTHHRNLVRLIGFCIEGSHRVLVYEYMSNGSLADFLFKAEAPPDWNERVRIALDVARGIHYLHEDCETHIIHCDIKPQNILMDECWIAKISDFGLAKLLMPDQTKTYTGIRGTRGYVAPEWHKSAPITMKADVYSFGIVLLELTCCRRHVEIEAAESEIVLLDWVYDCFECGELDKLVGNEEVEKKMLERMVWVGLWCTQEDPASRPTMKKVILMLEGIMNTPIPPSSSSVTAS